MGSSRRAERRPATHLSAAVGVGEVNRGGEDKPIDREQAGKRREKIKE
jgi:hypothetical protein